MRDILLALAEVLDEGARKSREWTYNVDRQQEADVLQAMADKARQIAGEQA